MRFTYPQQTHLHLHHTPGYPDKTKCNHQTWLSSNTISHDNERSIKEIIDCGQLVHHKEIIIMYCHIPIPWNEKNKASVDASLLPGLNQSQGESELDQKLIRLREAHNELAHQIWGKSDQGFLRKCMETTQPIRGQKMMDIQWSITKI